MVVRWQRLLCQYSVYDHVILRATGTTARCSWMYVGAWWWTCRARCLVHACIRIFSSSVSRVKSESKSKSNTIVPLALFMVHRGEPFH